MPEDQEDTLIAADSIWRELLQSIYKDKKAFVGAILVIAFVIIALGAPIFAPYDPYEVDMAEMLVPPSFTEGASEISDNSYMIGTDFLGRDIMSRIIYGARISLAIGLIPPLITLAIGTLLGMTAGYYGGKTDYLIMRLADICMSFPSLLLAMVVMYTLGASLFNIFIALSIVNWGGTSRIIRAQTLSLKQKEFVEAARSMGVSKWKILWRHIFPNCIPSLIVLFTLSVPEAIMSEAGLSFLGVGAQPPMPSWGLMISRGKEYLFSSPWVAITPGIAIFIVVIAFNFIGDGLRDALDPYTKHD
ncbi:ABC transporter permease [Fusibacter paucivorans]|uniref:ABC transporter permease n=2 Tax=Fusibacter paucivorans TaxID=76009 RepID=A0ABS5PQ72_9FIRM|nr:ABC transporter permease [Fusibacter paucivorans]